MTGLRPAALALLPAVLAAQAPAPAPDPFAPLRFLVGAWDGEEGQGAPGKVSRGAFTLQEDLDGRVLVRRSFAEVPAQGDRPAFRHEDLLTVFPEGGRLKALYTDNEGHVIHYGITPAPDGEGAVLLSEGPGPRFRMTLLRKGAGRVSIRFEIAPPGGEFATYLEAGARKRR